jgi:hypothetical protein
MSHITTVASDHYVYSPPTIKDWQRRGFSLGTELHIWQGKGRRKKARYHRCGCRLVVADAVFGIGPGAALRFVVCCYRCGVIFDTGISAVSSDADDHPQSIADLRAITAAQALNRTEKEA